MSNPNARNIVVTKSKYAGAARLATIVASVKASRKPMANGRTIQATVTPSPKKKRASGIHGRSAFRSAAVMPGATNAHSW